MIREFHNGVGGPPNTKNLRELAKKKFPDKSLSRIIHTPLKAMQQKGILKQDVVGCWWITAEMPEPIQGPEDIPFNPINLILKREPNFDHDEKYE
jgi:hypothetical protein